MRKRMKPASMPRLFALHIQWGGATDVAARWGTTYFLSMDKLSVAPSVKTVFDKVLETHVSKKHQDELWEMRFDNTGYFPPNEDSRATSGIKIDNDVIYEEISDLMQETETFRGQMVGSIVFHLEM